MERLKKSGITIIAVTFTLLLLIMIMMTGESITVLKYLFIGPMSSIRSITEVLILTVPLMVAGLGFTMMLYSGKINLSGEGSFILGGLTATIVATQFIMSSALHPIFVITMAAVAGGIVSLICALVDEYLKTDIIIASLMINYIVFYFSNYYLTNHMRDPNAGMIVSKEIPKTAKLPFIFRNIDLGIFVAIALAVLIYFVLYKSKFGLKLRITGDNLEYAGNLGINAPLISIFSQFIGGSLSGMAGGLYLLSAFKRFNWLGMPGFGWDAVLIALMAKQNPVKVIFSSLLIAYIRTGMNIMSRQTGISPDLTMIIQGGLIIIILLPKGRKVQSKTTKTSV